VERPAVLELPADDPRRRSVEAFYAGAVPKVVYQSAVKVSPLRSSWLRGIGRACALEACMVLMWNDDEQ
jgi:hypothetical protein